VPKIIEKELGLTKLLQKLQNGAILGGHSVDDVTVDTLLQ